MKELRKKFEKKFKELYKIGARGIRIDNNYIYGYKIETDLSNYPNRKTKEYKRKHYVDLKKHGVNLKKNEYIFMGGSHFYIGKLK